MHAAAAVIQNACDYVLFCYFSFPDAIYTCFAQDKRLGKAVVISSLCPVGKQAVNNLGEQTQGSIYY